MTLPGRTAGGSGRSTRRSALTRLTLGAGAWVAGMATRVQAAESGAKPDERLRAVVNGAHRGAANRARDIARHPYETLRFFGLQPHHQVIEIAPGAGWYTEILAPYLGTEGRLYAAHYPRDDAQEYRRKSRLGFEAMLSARPDLYQRVRVGSFRPGVAFDGALPVAGVDAVYTFRNVHNWIAEGHLDETLRAFHRALKPGGVIGVEEHRARPDATLSRIIESGYVTEDLLIERARAAGFRLQARSEVNANPKDSSDHPHGVWSLPPTLRGGTTDRERFLTIGESDRFTHLYVKV